MSSPQKDEKQAEDNKYIEFNVELDERNSQQKTTIDLNKIFHIDLSYNFDLLKDLLSTIIKNQKLKDNKILSLENQILDFKLTFNEYLKDPDTIKKIQENKAKVSSQLLKEKEFPDKSCLHYVINQPPNNIILEPSSKNEPVINQIIVSYLINLCIIKINF